MISVLDLTNAQPCRTVPCIDLKTRQNGEKRKGSEDLKTPRAPVYEVGRSPPQSHPRL